MESTPEDDIVDADAQPMVTDEDFRELSDAGFAVGDVVFWAEKDEFYGMKGRVVDCSKAFDVLGAVVRFLCRLRRWLLSSSGGFLSRARARTLCWLRCWLAVCSLAAHQFRLC